MPDTPPQPDHLEAALAAADVFRVPGPAVAGDPLTSDFDLAALPTDSQSGLTPDIDRKDAEEATRENVEILQFLQEKFYADGSKAMLVLLQAIDAGGKDSTIRRCFGQLNPQGVRVSSFKVPSDLEARHDFLWRHHADCPPKGKIAVHNRSHYETVLVERVRDLVPEDVWRRRYGQIVAFEQMLAGEGTIILKFFLHLSRDEQADRFRSRLKEPDKWWKFTESDLVERGRWHKYQEAFRDALAATSTPATRWYAVPADQRWYRDYLVTSVTLRAMYDADSRWPAPPAEMADEVKSYLRRLDAGD